MRSLNRRLFLSSSVGAGVLFGLMSERNSIVNANPFSTKPRGANDAINVAIVGLRKKGIQHIEVFRKLHGVRVTALCDADTQFIDLQKAKFDKRNETVKTYVDFRDVLDDRDIDAVVIVTPDHWHALMTIWACQAGKDVYIEKPATYSIWEGRKMIEAARKYNRIVQVGSQNRSDIGLRKAIPYIREGNLGKIQFMRAFSFGRRFSIEKTNGPQAIPKTCDYNLFQGPATLEPLRRQELHYDWHWFWDTGTGEIGNLGAHQIDHARWALGQETLSTRVLAIGGRFGYNDDGQTPNTMIAYFDFTPIPMTYETRSLSRAKGDPVLDTYKRLRTTMRLECEGGFFAGGRGGGWVYDNQGKRMKQFRGDGGATHQANFIKAVRSRNSSDLHADIRQGYISASLCHMVNISYRLGQRQSPDTIKKKISQYPQIVEAFDRLLSHLEANEIDLDRNPITIGPLLTFDEQKEQFIGQYSDWANMYLKRNYREPFVVPDIV
jgi:predicted dehydrogenase